MLSFAPYPFGAPGTDHEKTYPETQFNSRNLTKAQNGFPGQCRLLPLGTAVAVGGGRRRLGRHLDADGLAVLEAGDGKRVLPTRYFYSLRWEPLEDPGAQFNRQIVCRVLARKTTLVLP